MKAHTETSVADERKLATFQLGEEEFAVDIAQVQEIIRLQSVTAVPQAPPYVTGVVNLRGNVLPVIDLRARLGMELRAYDDATRVVVVRLNDALTGLIVDSVCEVMTVSERDISPTPAAILERFSENCCVREICTLEGGERIVLILDPHELLPSAQAMTSREADQNSQE